MLDISYQNMWTLSPELKTDSCICSWKLYTDHTCINYSHAEQVYECLLLRRSKYANYKVLCDLMSSFSFTTEDLRGSINSSTSINSGYGFRQFITAPVGSHMWSQLVLQLRKFLDQQFLSFSDLCEAMVFVKDLHIGMIPTLITNELIHLCSYGTQQHFSVFATLSLLLETCKDATRFCRKQISVSLRRV